MLGLTEKWALRRFEILNHHLLWNKFSECKKLWNHDKFLFDDIDIIFLTSLFYQGFFRAFVPHRAAQDIFYLHCYLHLYLKRDVVTRHVFSGDVDPETTKIWPKIVSMTNPLFPISLLAWAYLIDKK